MTFKDEKDKPSTPFPVNNKSSKDNNNPKIQLKIVLYPFENPYDINTDKRVREIIETFKKLRTRAAKLKIDDLPFNKSETRRQAKIISDLIRGINQSFYSLRKSRPEDEIIESIKFEIDYAYYDLNYLENTGKFVKRRPGNPNFKKQFPKAGFYQTAVTLMKENPDKSHSWLEHQLIQKYYDGDMSKKTTVYRRLKEFGL